MMPKILAGEFNKVVEITDNQEGKCCEAKR
jgi:hypothetical protein